MGRMGLKEPCVQRSVKGHIGIQPDASIFTENRDTNDVLQILGENRVTGDLYRDTCIVLKGGGGKNMNRVIGIPLFPTGSTVEMMWLVFCPPRPNDSWRSMLARAWIQGTYEERHNDGPHDNPRIHLFMGRDCYHTRMTEKIETRWAR